MGQVPTYPALAALVPGDLAYIARPSEGASGSHSFDLGTALAGIQGDIDTSVEAETARAEGAEEALDTRLTATEYDVSLLQGAVTSGRRIYATYASAVSDAAVPVLYAAVTLGQVAEVPTTDTGTHTDPVVGGTVNNTGIFRWSVSPAGWQRIADVDAAAAEGYADDAAAAAAAAAASAASIHQGVLLTGDEAPATNTGSNGDIYIDTVALLEYGPKTAGAWGQGRPITIAVAGTLTAHDYRYGTLPTGLAITRAQTTTDAVYNDPPGRAYNTFAANSPRWRSDKGLGLFPNSKNYLLNSAAPATQTVTLPVGVHILWGNGTGTLTSAAGTATGTGFGVLNLPDRTFQTITITVGGTVSVTLAGNCNYFQLEGNTSIAARSVPTPLIVTTSAALTRDGDVPPITGAYLAFLNSAAGTILYETVDVLPWATSTSCFLLGSNTNNSLYFDNAGITFQYWNGGAVAGFTSLGDGNVKTGRVRLVAAWSGATYTVGGGTRIPKDIAGAWANGAPMASAWLGAGSASVTADDSLSGWIVREERSSSRLTNDQLFTAYTSLPLIGSSAIDNYSAAVSVPKWKGARKKLTAAVMDPIILAYGTSHTAGTNPTSAIRPTSWPSRLTTLLAARGITANNNAVFGNGGVSSAGVIATGVSTYDPRVTYSAGWSITGSSVGDLLTTTSGARTIDFVADGTTDSITVYVATAPGFGTVDVSTNGGASLATINCNVAVSILSTTVNLGSGANTIRLTTSGQTQVIGYIAHNSAVRAVTVINGGRPGARASGLATTGALPPNSAMAVLTAIAPTLTFFECGTNDAADNTASEATYTGYMNTVITTAKLSGDCVVMSSPPSQSTVATLANQAKYAAWTIAAGLANGCPVIDAHNGMTGGYDVWNRAGAYFDTIHLSGSALNGYAMIAAEANAVLP